MRDILEKLCEAVHIERPSADGLEAGPDTIGGYSRGTSGRQFMDQPLDIESPPEEKLDLDENLWLLNFISQDYGDSEQYSGPVPIRLEGHKDLTDSEWQNYCKRMYKEIHGTGEKTMFLDDELSKDVRDLINPGKYHRPFFTFFPNGHDRIYNVVNFVDDIQKHPISTPVYRELASAGPLTVKKIDSVFDSITRHLSEPSFSKHNTGDILDVSSEIRMNLN